MADRVDSFHFSSLVCGKDFVYIVAKANFETKSKKEVKLRYG